MEQKKNKKATIQLILKNEGFNPEEQSKNIKEELIGEKNRLDAFRAARDKIVEDVVDEQGIFQHFEKNFFQELEQFVIEKKKNRK